MTSISPCAYKVNGNDDVLAFVLDWESKIMQFSYQAWPSGYKSFKKEWSTEGVILPLEEGLRPLFKPS